MFYFEGTLRTAIHRLKYEGVTALAHPLGCLMADYWLTQPMPSDVLIPVPLHRDRHRRRGFNQAALLAEELSRQVNIPMDQTTLARHRATASQIGLDFEERRSNVHDAFQCVGNGLGGRRVLLVDDVYTSGSTLGACAVALIDGGASSVQALTLARAR